jgi:hypothetical protein
MNGCRYRARRGIARSAVHRREAALRWVAVVTRHHWQPVLEIIGKKRSNCAEKAARS